MIQLVIKLAFLFIFVLSFIYGFVFYYLWIVSFIFLIAFLKTKVDNFNLKFKNVFEVLLLLLCVILIYSMLDLMMNDYLKPAGFIGILFENITSKIPSFVSSFLGLTGIIFLLALLTGYFLKIENKKKYFYLTSILFLIVLNIIGIFSLLYSNTSPVFSILGGKAISILRNYAFLRDLRIEFTTGLFILFVIITFLVFDIKKLIRFSDDKLNNIFDFGFSGIKESEIKKYNSSEYPFKLNKLNSIENKYNTETNLINEVFNDETSIKNNPNTFKLESERKIEDIVLSKEFVYPPLDLLDSSQKSSLKIIEKNAQEKAKLILKKLEEYNIRGEIVGIQSGPVITRYAFLPAPGTKINQVASLSDELAMGLESHHIRVAHIPKKPYIGIEIPNDNPEIVYLRDIISSDIFQKTSGPLILGLGKTPSGQPFVLDLLTQPHLLIAGATGSGKSVCLHSLILSILYRNSPDRVKLILIDPKILEFSFYSGIPHLYAPVVTDPKQAVQILKWAVFEMEKRRQIMFEVGARSLSDYNKKVEEGRFDITDIDRRNKLKKLPYIVIIIDEFGDLVLTMGKDIENSLVRLAQMARAIGIHLILATQRPSVNVIAGLIKANFPSRITFQLPSKIDSRTILDQGGAEKLLGKGDMLVIPAGVGSPLRVHGAFVSSAEIERVVDFIIRQNLTSEILSENDFINISDSSGDLKGSSFLMIDRDPLFSESARLVVMYNWGSSSLLQRKLKIGYPRAVRIMDQLEQAGIVGPPNGSNPRVVLVTPDELEKILQNF